jgi:hypothetical protein
VTGLASDTIKGFHKGICRQDPEDDRNSMHLGLVHDSGGHAGNNRIIMPSFPADDASECNGRHMTFLRKRDGEDVGDLHRAGYPVKIHGQTRATFSLKLGKAALKKAISDNTVEIRDNNKNPGLRPLWRHVWQMADKIQFHS